MTSPDGVFLHIGMARTGTSALQSDYFSKAPELCYLGKNSGVAELDAANKLLTRKSYFELDTEALKAAFDNHRAGHPGVPIFSDEDLSVWKFLEPKELGSSAGDVFPYPRLIYVVRRPVEWVQSQYYFRLATFRRDALFGPNAYVEKHLSQLRIGNDLSEVQFTRTFEAFRRTSRATDHLILPYELMAGDRRQFLERIETFLGAPGALTRIYDAGEPPPRKVRLDSPQASYIRTLGFWRRDPERFLELARVFGSVGPREHRREFETLAANPQALFEEWVDWFKRGQRPVYAALARENQDVIKALHPFDDYQLRPGLVAHLLEVEQEETAAMKARFGVDLEPYGYSPPA